MISFFKFSYRKDKTASFRCGLLIIIFVFMLIIGASLSLSYSTSVSAIDEVTTEEYTTSSNKRTTTEEYTTEEYTTDSTSYYTSTSSYYDDDDYVQDHVSTYDYAEIDEDNSLYSSSRTSSQYSSSSRKSSSSTDSLLPENESKNPDINSQDWNQLLANLSSNSKNSSQFTFSDSAPNSSNSNSSWILWLGILFIILALAGLFWVIYTEFISKKSPKKQRAAASAKLAAKNAQIANAKHQINSKSNSSPATTQNTNEYDDLYYTNTSKRKPPQPPNIPIPGRSISISGSVGKPNPPTPQVPPRKSSPPPSHTTNRNKTYNSQPNHNDPYSPKNTTSTAPHKQNKSFWDNFFGK